MTTVLVRARDAGDVDPDRGSTHRGRRPPGARRTGLSDSVVGGQRDADCRARDPRLPAGPALRPRLAPAELSRRAAGEQRAGGEVVIGGVVDPDQRQPAGGRDRHVAGPLGAGRAARPASPAGGVPRRPRAARRRGCAPSSGRRRRPTRATVTRSPSRTTSSASSVRIVVAPSRRRQKAAKSCSPSSSAGGQRHRVGVERRAASRRCRPGAAAAGPDGGVGQPVDVVRGASAPNRASKSGWRLGRPRAPRCRAAARRAAGAPAGRRCSSQSARGTSQCATWPVACTPASVRPATVSSTGTAQHRGQRLLQVALDRALAGLARPAVQRRAVVADRQTKTDEPAHRCRWRARPGAAGCRSGRVTSGRAQPRRRGPARPRWRRRRARRP